MVRLAFVLASFALVSSAGASDLPRAAGMYPAQGAPLAMLDSKLDVEVRGPIVEATVTQTFRNDTDRVTEATYVFPLPVDAAVSAMSIESGARTIHAAVERRDQATKRYEQAVAAGLGAGLLDEDRPDVFTQTVSAIPARGTVTIALRFDATARYANGVWELVLPMVVAPRYVPGTASGRPTTGTGRAPDTNRAPDASRVTPGGGPGAGGSTAVTIGFADPVDDVSSPTHELAKASNYYTFTDPHSDHDAVIRWRARVPAAGWVEPDDDGGYAAVVVEAPAAAPRPAAMRCLIVLDRSATTRGDADATEHPIVRALLGGLGAKDRASIAGSDRFDWRAPDDALRAVDVAWAKPAGAFDLTKVLAGLRGDGAAIVLVSDGLVADDKAAITAAAHAGAPIHVIGVGPAPNRGLLVAIAAATGGTVRFAVLGDDPAALARDVLADAATPPAPLAVTWGTLAAYDQVPATLPRLGAGQAALVVARVKRVQPANARVRGDVFAFTSVPARKPPSGATTPLGALGRRWARIKLDELIAGGDARAITAHALRSGLVSPFTSLVAIGDETVVSGGVKHSVAVPVSVPDGMHWRDVKREVTVDTTTVDQRTRDDDDKPRKKLANKPQPTPKPAEDREEDGKDDEDDARSVRPQTAPAAPPPAVATGSAASDYGAQLEVVTSSSSSRRALRLAASLGGGLVVVNRGASSVVAVAGRVEIGGRTLGGVEGSLWLVDGLHAQGDLLATVTRRGLGRWFELGAGFGLHLGSQVGPAFDLVLRARLPWRHYAGYLRFDGALLLHDGTRDGQSTTTLGVERRW